MGPSQAWSHPCIYSWTFMPQAMADVRRGRWDSSHNRDEWCWKAFQCLWACLPVPHVSQDVVLQFLLAPWPQDGSQAACHYGALHGSQEVSDKQFPTLEPRLVDLIQSGVCHQHPAPCLTQLVWPFQNMPNHKTSPGFPLSEPFKQTLEKVLCSFILSSRLRVSQLYDLP